METVYYNPTDIWAPDSDESRKYEDGTKKVVDAEGNGSYSTYGNSDFEEKTISFCTVTKSMKKLFSCPYKVFGGKFEDLCCYSDERAIFKVCSHEEFAVYIR